MQEINIVFSIAVLIVSVVIHEFFHGYTAYILGDNTAKDAGRLTLNPFKHLDLFGSIIVPFLAYISAGFIFGWAKPVPYNPYNLKNQRFGPAIVAVTGPLANFFVAIFFGLALRYGGSFASLPSSFYEISSLIVLINLILGIFNLIPIPPLDGSKVLFAFLPERFLNIQIFFEKYGFFFILFFIFFLFQYLTPIIEIAFRLIAGASI